MIRGFGEPLSAAYARLYLVHAAEQGDQIHTTRGKSLLELWVMYYFSSRQTASNNLCLIYRQRLRVAVSWEEKWYPTILRVICL